MAVLTVQDGSKGYAAASFSAASGGGDTVAGGQRSGGWHLPVVLLVENADATATNVTVAGLPALSVPASGIAVIPVVGNPYGDPVAVTYSKVTSLTVAAVRLTSPLE